MIAVRSNFDALACFHAAQPLAPPFTFAAPPAARMRNAQGSGDGISIKSTYPLMFFFNSSVFPPVVAWRRVFLLSFFRQGFDTLLTGGCSHGTHGTGRPLHRPRDAPRQPDEVPPGPRPWTQAGHSGVKIFGNNYGIYFVIPISPFFSPKTDKILNSQPNRVH